MKVHVLGRAEIEQALASPASVFDSPFEVLDAEGLTREQKIRVLKCWELDARALSRATEENMAGGEAPPLDAVNDALTRIDPEGKALADFEKAPTKL